MKINKTAIISLILLAGSAGLIQGADVSTFVMGAKKKTLSPDSNTMSAGYYPTRTLSDIESDLIASNIKKGVSIFGIIGTLVPSTGAVTIVLSTGLPDTGQTTCYSAVGQIIPCPGPGAALAQDGSYQPATIQPSYTDNLDGTITDSVTGLIWIKDPNLAGIGGPSTWLNAINACENLSYGNSDNWRLPNINELWSIVNYQNLNPTIDTAYFLNTRNSYYWSSTTDQQDAAFAKIVNFSYGDINRDFKTSVTTYNRCVRGGP